MIKPRIIPILLLKDGNLVKTQKFSNERYIGDPINVVSILNEKEIDELILLDIDAVKNGKGPDFLKITEIVSECFIPVCYGGGITSIEQMKKLFYTGIEKVSLNTAAFVTPKLVYEAASIFGSSSVVASVDVKKNFFGKYTVMVQGGRKSISEPFLKYVKSLESEGAGEILINSVDCDGMMKGYDLELIKMVSSSVKIPVIACGGAGSLDDMKGAVIKGGASAAAAGSFFIYHGPHRAVLVTYPSQKELDTLFSNGDRM